MRRDKKYITTISQKGNKIKKTLLTVQGKPVLVCVCCLSIPILESWEGSGNRDPSTFGERRRMEGREIRGSLVKFWLRSRNWREKQGPDLPPPSPHIPIHPLHVALLPVLGWCLKAHETPSSPIHLAYPPEMMSANPAGLALPLPFAPVCEEKRMGRARCPTASTLLANAGPCPPITPQINQQTRAGLIHICAGEWGTPPLPSPCPVSGTSLSRPCLLVQEHSQEDLKCPL